MVGVNYNLKMSSTIFWDVTAWRHIPDDKHRCEELKSDFTNVFYFFYKFNAPPLWSSGQISWLQIQRSGFDSRPYQIFWEVMGLERGPLSLVSKSSGSGLGIRHADHVAPSIRKS
jgi:hypothetical protein